MGETLPQAFLKMASSNRYKTEEGQHSWVKQDWKTQWLLHRKDISSTRTTCIQTPYLPLSSSPTWKLIELYCLIWSMACQQKIVSWLYHPCKPHEQCWIDTHCCKTRNEEKKLETCVPKEIQSFFKPSFIFNLKSCCQKSFLGAYSCPPVPNTITNNVQTWVIKHKVVSFLDAAQFCPKGE